LVSITGYFSVLFSPFNSTNEDDEVDAVFEVDASINNFSSFFSSMAFFGYVSSFSLSFSNDIIGIIEEDLHDFLFNEALDESEDDTSVLEDDKEFELMVDKEVEFEEEEEDEATIEVIVVTNDELEEGIAVEEAF